MNITQLSFYFVKKFFIPNEIPLKFVNHMRSVIIHVVTIMSIVLDACVNGLGESIACRENNIINC